MKALVGASLLALGLMTSGSAAEVAGETIRDPDPAVERWRPYIREASSRFEIPEAWIEQVMNAESGGHATLAGRPITSRAGAMGLMQLMPGTWADMRSKLQLGDDPHRPRDNILAGTAYLRLMYDRFGYPGLFAAYNAGPARYAAHLATGSPLPVETVAYVNALTGSDHVRGARPQTRRFEIFVSITGLPSERVAAPTRDAPFLFVPLRRDHRGGD